MLDLKAMPEAPVRTQLRAMAHLAGRTLRKDFLGRENPEWAAMHERINELLNQLELEAEPVLHDESEEPAAGL